MTLVTTFQQIESLEHIKHYADGILVGDALFGTRLSTSFSLSELQNIILKKGHLKLYIMANQMMTQQQLNAFEAYVKSLPLASVDGIVVSDIGAVFRLVQLNLAHLVIFHPETLLTNHEDFNMFEHERIRGAVVAKEITLKSIQAIAQHKKYPLWMMAHGYLSMFYSRRHLIKTYEQKYEVDIDHQKHLTMTEKSKQDRTLNVLEDQAGTHVFRERVMSAVFEINALKTVVDVFVIDGVFHGDDYIIDILKLFHDPSETHIQLLQDKYQETWDQGFLHQQTVYLESK
jgi:U32 family peptidase